MSQKVKIIKCGRGAEIAQWEGGRKEKEKEREEEKKRKASQATMSSDP